MVFFGESWSFRHKESDQIRFYGHYHHHHRHHWSPMFRFFFLFLWDLELDYYYESALFGAGAQTKVRRLPSASRGTTSTWY